MAGGRADILLLGSKIGPSLEPPLKSVLVRKTHHVPVPRERGCGAQTARAQMIVTVPGLRIEGDRLRVDHTSPQGSTASSALRAPPRIRTIV